MRALRLTTIGLAGLLAISLAVTLRADPPTMKMTTDIPANVITPDRTETRLGTLEFTDGFPSAETSQKIWDFMDFQRAVEVMIMTTPAASLSGFRRGIREFGPDNETMIVWEGRHGLPGPDPDAQHHGGLHVHVDRPEGRPDGHGDPAERPRDHRRRLVPLRHGLRERWAGQGAGREVPPRAARLRG